MNRHRKKRGKEKMLFERFGEFASAQEINEIAVNLRKEKDFKSIRILAKENGIDEDIAEMFAEGELLYMADYMSAAIGKIEVEKKELDCAEILEDWCEYINDMCLKDEQFAMAVRSKEKHLKNCIGELLKWGFAHQHKVDKEIMKAAGVTAGKCTLGIPGMATAKKIIKDYYLGK